MGEVKKKRKQKRRIALLKRSVLVLVVLLMGLMLVHCGTAKKEKDENTQQTENTQQAGLAGSEMIEESQSVENTEEEFQVIEPEISDFTMFFTGDVMIQRCTDLYDSEGINRIISEYIEQEMNSADMTMINNEFPFSNRGSQHPDKQFTFRVDPKYVSMLQDMGVDVASLANNHALDFGTEALLDSFTTLEDAGIPYVGAGETKERAEEAVFVEAGGRTIGVLSASRVIPVVEWNIETRQPGLFCTYDSTRLVQRIKEVEEQCDYVVVFVHWGIEREAYPEEYQHNLAKQYIDAGADLVIGNHAHVPQGIEYYKGVPIVYCMGNFIFNPDMTDTYALKAVWDAEGNTSLQVIPVDTENYYTSELTGEEAQVFYDYLEGISFGVSIDENGFVTDTAAE
ncbi:MAG: CapA family protein [Agathobacter sp.]|nr:CapA family protein [Agathobacter sp.]